MRKIRVICSDPYATDCSSDDEESIENRRPANGKIFVQEISVSIPAIQQDSLSKLISDATDSSSKEDGCINQEINSTVAENHRSLLRANHPGIQMTEPGKWDVQICHPMAGTLIWLGSYNTIEEATNIYKNKKLEFALLSELIKQQNQRSRNIRQRFVVGDLTIFETSIGKWATWTKDPISNVKIWVGAYTTPEQAVESYCKKKLDVKIASSPTDSEVASFIRPGIMRTKTGKWGVTIQHPSLKSRYWLGSFDTIEEAAEVYDKKKSELDAGSGSRSGSVANQESCFFENGALTDGISTYVINSQGDRVLYKGVRLRQSGRWAAEIKDPIKGKTTHLGTFDTPEEAADAYNKRKRELDQLTSNGNKKPKSKGANPEADDDIDVDVVLYKGVRLRQSERWAAEIKDPIKGKNTHLGTFDTLEEAADAYNKRKRELDQLTSNGNKKPKSKGANPEADDDIDVDVVRYKGVRLRQSGRWVAEIKDPIKGKNTHLGTFDTPEEAADAYKKRKRELDELTSNGNKKPKSKGTNPEADDDIDVDVDVVIKAEPNNTYLSNSTVTAVSSQNSEGSNNTNNNDKQIPGFPFATEDEFGSGVIDCYGQFIGEYSTIDDELWFIGSRDYDEFDVRGAIGGTQDLALDLKPSFP